MPFKLRGFVRSEIDELTIDLSREVIELRLIFDRRPAQWRTSDEGAAVEAWIGKLEYLATDLENISVEPEKP